MTDTARQAVFYTTRDDRTFEFDVRTDLTVTSFAGTVFVPNRCTARVSKGEVVSVSLEHLDENGSGVDDPAGPDGAELAADFGGGEFTASARGRLPEIACQALSAVEAMLGRPNIADLRPKFPPGTPEYEAYARELRAELRKFAAGEDPYPYGSEFR